MRKLMKKAFASLMTVTMVISLLSYVGQVYAAMPEYEIYPKPHKISYENSDFILRNKANVVYGEGIDTYTKKRLKEITDLKDMTISTSNEIVDNEKSEEKVTNILVGIYGSGDYVDNYVKKNLSVSADLFNKTDSYKLIVNDGTIIVLGRDTDSAFYGLTSLYHVFNQLDSLTIRNFEIEDYADVVSRGFIEGYYGNPWSTEDRIELMKWSGYYKANSYFYAPKDDPKHNAKWRDLYTAEEIENMIKPLAQAGNESKCRFVYALHPYMKDAAHPNPLRHDSNYQADLKVMQDKFAQVIDAGVRQIAILADDAPNVGSSNYIKMLNDMTDWLKEKQKTYPDLKLTLPFCVQEYMGWGQSYFKDFPDNVQIIMTGGQVFGEASENFTNSFVNTVGKGPYLWINWPCTDNSRKHLIMGGYDTFLHPGVNPSKIEGIVLNPMQQSEPSKVAIFGNACYTWNIWESKAEADEIWNDSFNYVDHNSSLSTQSSKALRELSKHMINQNMIGGDNPVTPLDESIELKPKLDALKSALNSNTATVDQVNDLIKEFETLAKASQIYRNSGNKRIKDQIIYWLDCWDDTAGSAIAYLEAIKANIEGDNTTLLNQYAQGQKLFASSKTHALWYRDHYENAEVGVQHIVPFVKTLNNYISKKVETIANPDVLSPSYISNAFTNIYSGSEKDLFDGNDQTGMQIHEPNRINQGDYIGVQYNKAITVNSIRFLMGGGQNHIFKSKVQYTTNGTDWVDVNGTIYNRPLDSTEAIEISGLNLEKVIGIRLIATENNTNPAWMTIQAIDINVTKTTVSYSNNIKIPANGGSINNVIDGNKSTEVYFQALDADSIPAEATVTVNFGKVKEIESVYIAQALSQDNPTDYLDDAVLEYYNEASQTWQEVGALEQKTEQTINANISTHAIRIRNKTLKRVWWRLGEIQANFVSDESQTALKLTASLEHGLRVATHNVINDAAKNNKIEYMVDGDPSTIAWLASDTAGENGNIQTDDAIVVSFNRTAELKSVTLNQGPGDLITDGKIMYQDVDGNWHDWNTFNGASDDVIITGTVVKAKAIKIVSTQNYTKWWKVKEISVEEVPFGVKDYVYTNTTTTLLSNVLTAEDGVSLSGGEITLNAQDYIGIQFKSIKDLHEIVLNYTGNSSPLKLQVSKNGLVWTDVTTGTQSEDARYIRLLNDGSTSLDLKINEFKVTTNEISPMSFHSSDINPIAGWGDSRDNNYAFDGNMSSVNKIGGRPTKDQYIIYDLGQQVDVNSLRIYTADSQNDYIRDAKIQLSTDLTNWTDLFTIGDGVTDTDANSTARETFLNNDSNYPNYVYAGSDSLNAKGRYLRILITADFPQRAIVINEIMINHGAYLPVENAREYVGALEERGHQPSYMGDGDLTTTYKSALPNSSMTYYVSQPEGLTAFRVIQSGDTSGAKVKATFYSDVTRGVATETVEVGQLDQAINEFVIPSGKKLLSVEIVWQDKIPEIAEILTTKSTVNSVDKTALNAILTKTAKSEWTKASIEAFDSAKAIATGLKDNNYVSQETIDSAVAALQKAIDNALLKADPTELEGLVNAVISNDQDDYTVKSFMDYQNAIDEAKDALQDKENLSVNQATQLVQSIQTAKTALEYSAQMREKAELALTDDTTLAETNYSKNSYQAYATAKQALEAAILKDKAATTQAERITPDNMRKLRTAFDKAIKGLADVSELKAVIAEFDNYNADLYTESTYKDYKNAVDDAKNLLVSGTKDTIVAQITLVNEKKNALVLVTVSLDDAIADALKLKSENYTEKSYSALKKVIEEAQALVNPTEQEKKDYIKKITDAKKALVSIVALKERVQEAEKLDKDTYTVATYTELEKAIENAKKAMKDGNNQAVKSAFDNLTTAIQSLKVSGTNELATYRKNLKLKDAYYYTTDSYKLYKEAYDKVIGLPKDVSLDEFTKAKLELEKYTDSLQYKGADYSQVKDLIAKIPTDLSSYTSDSVAKLNKVLASIVYNKSILDQSIVDQYAKELYQAIQGLTKLSQHVATGDSTYVLPMIMTMAIAGYGIYLLKKKREEI